MQYGIMWLTFGSILPLLHIGFVSTQLLDVYPWCRAFDILQLWISIFSGMIASYAYFSFPFLKKLLSCYFGQFYKIRAVFKLLALFCTNFELVVIFGELWVLVGDFQITYCADQGKNTGHILSALKLISTPALRIPNFLRIANISARRSNEKFSIQLAQLRQFSTTLLSQKICRAWWPFHLLTGKSKWRKEKLKQTQ